MKELSHKVSQLTEIINSFTPVVKELKCANDAVQQDSISHNDGPPTNETGALIPADSRSDDFIGHLVHKVTDNEPTDKALPENSPLSSTMS